MGQKRIRYAVIGQGYFAQAAILPAFEGAPNSELVALFSEDPHRFLVAAEPGVLQLPADLARRIGTVGGAEVVVNGHSVPLDQCGAAWREAIPGALAG